MDVGAGALDMSFVIRASFLQGGRGGRGALGTVQGARCKGARVQKCKRAEACRSAKRNHVIVPTCRSAKRRNAKLDRHCWQ